MNLNNNIKIVIIIKIDDIHKLESVNIDNNITYRSTYFENILEKSIEKKRRRKTF